MEPAKAIPEKNGAGDVVLEMPKLEEEEVAFVRQNGAEIENPKPVPSIPKPSFSVNILVGSSPKNLEQENLRFRGQVPPISEPIEEISTTPKPDKPPSTPKKKTFSKSSFSNPKSRLIEHSSSSGSSKSGINKKNSQTWDDDEDFEEDPDPRNGGKSGKCTICAIFEWIVFVSFLGCLIASLSLDKFDKVVILGLKFWKWCVLVLVVCCGRLYTRWMMIVVLFLIRRKLLLNEKVLYFVYGVRVSVRFFVWLCLVLVSWVLLVNYGVSRSKETTEILNQIRRALASSLVGAALWLLKTLFVKIIAANFQGKRFFNRIKEAIFHQHVFEVLSQQPPDGENKGGKSTSIAGANFVGKKKDKESRNGNGMIKWLKNMKEEKASAWTMKEFIDVIGGSNLSYAADEDGDRREKDTKITSELQVRQAANRIFKKLAKSNKCIQRDDLLPYFDEKELKDVLSLFKGAAETGEIKKKVLKEWLLEIYRERKSLAFSLRDSKTAIEELNRLASGVVLVVIIIVWLLLMGFLTTKILLLISSQLLLVVFMFGNTVKTVFEAIIFVFVVHPFDVSDRCVIDGVQMIVEEVNLLSTVFLKYDNEKIYYPNSVLATKPIGNFYRSPDMGDSVEFAIDVSTTVDQIKALKEKIKGYLDKNLEYWRPNHSVVVKDFDDVNKIKMALYVTHTINFQNYGDRNSRRSDLILELKAIMEDMGIKFHLLPVQAQIIGSALPFVGR